MKSIFSLELAGDADFECVWPVGLQAAGTDSGQHARWAHGAKPYVRGKFLAADKITGTKIAALQFRRTRCIAPRQLAAAGLAPFIDWNRFYEINAARHLPTT